jgi:hypothetical protein
MKKHFRYLTFLPLLFIMLLGTTLTSTSNATARAKIDPACLSSCQLELQTCFIGAAGSNSDENYCVARYRHCIAQGGKH